MQAWLDWLKCFAGSWSCHQSESELLLFSIPAETRTIPYFRLQSLSSFTVTKPGDQSSTVNCSRVSSCKPCVWKDLMKSSRNVFVLCPLIADDPRHRPDLA